jgi:WD40 repeat protein
MLALIQPIQDQQRRVNPAIALLDVANGKELGFLPENRQVHSMQFSPDGKLLAVGDGVGKVRLWDIQAKQFKLLDAYDLPVSALVFSADGKTLATGSSAPGIKLWDVATGAQHTNIIRGHLGQVWALAFSPDGQLVASGGRNSPIKVWSVSGIKVEATTHELISEHWANFTFSPNGKLMAAGCRGETVNVWNVEDFSLKAPLPGASYAVAFSLDSRELLTASLKELPLWWNLETTNSRPAPAYHGGRMTNRVTCVDFSPDRTMAALGFKDGFLELVEIASAKELARWKAHNDEVRSVAFSPNGSLLVSGARDHSVAEWDVSTQRALGSNVEHKGAICTVAFSIDGKMVATGCGAGSIKLWNPFSPLTNSLASIT